MSPTGVYCGIGACEKCQHPRCGCWCHRVKPRVETPKPKSKRTHAVAAIYDDEGRRVCPGCLAPFVRKPGPGRYPTLCVDCRRTS